MEVANTKASEIDLNQIFHKLLEGKIIIIVITLLLVIMSAFVANSRPILFQSSAIIKIGNYEPTDMHIWTGDRNSKEMTNQSLDMLTNYQFQIEDSKNLIRALQFRFNYENNKNINIFQRDTNIIQVETKATIGEGSLLLNDVFEYIFKRHQRIVDNYNSQQIQILKTKIENLNSSIENINSSIENRNSSIEIDFLEKIKLLERRIEKINTSINFYEKELAIEIKSNKALAITAISSEAADNADEIKYNKSNNNTEFIFLQRYHEIKDKIFLLTEEKIDVEIKLVILSNKIINFRKNLNVNFQISTNSLEDEENLVFIPNDIFKLTQEKLKLDGELKLFQSQSLYNDKTSLVGEIASTEIYSKSILIILFGFVSGLILSIALVFSISAFKNIFKGN